MCGPAFISTDTACHCRARPRTHQHAPTEHTGVKGLVAARIQCVDHAAVVTGELDRVHTDVPVLPQQRVLVNQHLMFGCRSHESVRWGGACFVGFAKAKSGVYTRSETGTDQQRKQDLLRDAG